MVGDPGLLQERPDIAALLPEGGGDGEQSAAADRTLAGLDAMADLALNHRLVQGTYSYGEDCVNGGVVGGLDSLDLEKDPQAIAHLEQLPAGLLQGVPFDRAVLVVVPVGKKLLLQAQQLCSELSAGARAFGDGGEIADQIRPAQPMGRHCPAGLPGH